MAKSKEGREEEFHKSIIRQQKKEIKRLNQKIRSLEKNLNYDQYKSSKSTKEKEPDLNTCQECGKGFLIITDLGIRKIITCNLCPYRKVTR